MNLQDKLLVIQGQLVWRALHGPVEADMKGRVSIKLWEDVTGRILTGDLHGYLFAPGLVTRVHLKTARHEFT